MSMIPTDEQIATGDIPQPDDMAPVDLGLVGEEPKKRRGRQPYPRDPVTGEIIRPDGTRGTKPRTPRTPGLSPEQVVSVRRERVARYTSIIEQDVNPFVLDLAVMVSGFPREACLEQRGNSLVYTQIGQAHVFSPTQVRVYATTAARLQETERGQELIDKMNNAAPYAFLAVSGVMTIMWFLQVYSMRKLAMQNVQGMMSQMMGSTQRGAAQQNGNGNAPSIGDMLAGFFGKKKQAAQPEEPTRLQQEESILKDEESVGLD